MSTRYFKVRNRETGLYATSGLHNWTKNGKIWAGTGPLTNALRLVSERRFDGGFRPSWEVVEFELHEVGQRSPEEFLK